MRDDWKNKKVQDSLVVFALGLALGAYSLIRFHAAAVKTDWALSPCLFPLLLSAFALLLAAALFWEGRREARGRGAESATSRPAPEKLRYALGVLLLSTAYAALLPWLRFLPATAIFLAAMLLLLGERRWRMVAVLSLSVPLVLYAVFGLALHVRLP